MRTSFVLLASMAASLTEACYRIYGNIDIASNTTSHSTTFAPNISVQKNGTTICTGSVYNAATNTFSPGGIPTLSTFAGPWGAFNCSSAYIQVDVFGVMGQALVRDSGVAFFVAPEALAWSQWVISGNVAGVPEMVVNDWSFDSGSTLGC